MDVITSHGSAAAPAAARRSPAAAVGRIALGALCGLVLGVMARAWMRLISSDPEYTWHGTLSIVIGFAWFGAWTTGASLLVRSSRRWRRAVARGLGVLGTLPLFAAAGGVMLPTVAFGTWLAARPPRRWWLRLPILAVAAVPVLFVTKAIIDAFGASVRSAAGIAGMVALYTVVAVVARRAFVAEPGARQAS